MATRGKTWQDQSGPVDPFALFAKHGCKGARIRLWVGDEGTNRLTYATETARRAQQAGLKPYLVIFLSDNWADMVKQPAPAVWKDLSPEKKLAAIEAYTESVVRHMASERRRHRHLRDRQRDRLRHLRRVRRGMAASSEHRLHAATRLAAHGADSQGRPSGRTKARPKAKFILHLSQWNNVDY